MRMADLLEECITDLSAPGGSKDYPAFQATFCARCRNPGCAHAKWATDKFGARVQTQVDRFFGSPQADPNDPKYAQLKDFQDCMREAIRLEAADKAGDWEVPEVDISDGQTETARADTTSHVDAAVRTLARVKGREEPELPDPLRAAVEDSADETETLMEQETPEDTSPPPESEDPAPEPSQPRHFQGSTVGPGNTPAPDGGIIIGDGPPPEPKWRPGEAKEDWTPKEKPKTVQPGATVKMGGGDE